MSDKKCLMIGFLIGILLGIITSVCIVSIIINTVGDSFQIENINISIAINQTQLENVIRSTGYQNQIMNVEPVIDDYMYNGIYGWWCDDDSSYNPSIYDVRQRYIDRGCRIVSFRNDDVNRSYYIENGWD